jgi:hypothetical protein
VAAEELIEEPTSTAKYSDDWWARFPKAQRCVAHKSTTGEACRKAAVKGAVVCRSHGGAAAQVRAKAQERLVLAADSAIEFIRKIMDDPQEPTPIRLQAARDLADRNSLTGKHQIELTTPEWRGIIPAILVSASEAVETAERVIDASYDALTLEIEDGPSYAELEAVSADVVEEHRVAADPKVPAHTAARLGWKRR